MDGTCWRWGRSGRLPCLANRITQTYLFNADWSTQWTSTSNWQSTSAIMKPEAVAGRSIKNFDARTPASRSNYLHYRPPTKLQVRESNVFTGVCHSVGGAMFPVMPPRCHQQGGWVCFPWCPPGVISRGSGYVQGVVVCPEGGWGYVERGWGHVHGGWLCPEGVWYVWGGGGGYTMGPGYTAPPVLTPGGGHQHTYGW